MNPTTKTAAIRLPAEEYIEQAYLFEGLKARLSSSEPVQLLLVAIRQEILTTAKLPMAIDYMLAELNHSGSMAIAMQKLAHYFAPFQSWLMTATEDDNSRLDMMTTLAILEHEARHRSEGASPVALFFYQLEVLCRHRLSYDKGLKAMSGDPFYDQAWSQWLLDARKKLGFVDIADLVYVHSEYYAKSSGGNVDQPDAILFGEKEGRIALANRRRDPLYLFSALQRQLKYPSVPLRPKADLNVDMVPRMLKRMDQMETRMKLLEDEQRDAGIDLSKFFKRGEGTMPAPPDSDWE